MRRDENFMIQLQIHRRLAYNKKDKNFWYRSQCTQLYIMSQAFTIFALSKRIQYLPIIIKKQ